MKIQNLNLLPVQGYSFLSPILFTLSQLNGLHVDCDLVDCDAMLVGHQHFG